MQMLQQRHSFEKLTETMMIRLSKDATCGVTVIPEGEYMVALSNQNSEIVLTGRGKQFKLPAVKRRQNSKTRTTNVMFYCGGGPLWSIVVSTPKFGEWIAMIEYVRDSGH